MATPDKSHAQNATEEAIKLIQLMRAHLPPEAIARLKEDMTNRGMEDIDSTLNYLGRVTMGQLK